MDENFHFTIGFPGNGPDFSERKLPGQIDALNAEALGQLHTLYVRNTHLSAGMQLHVRGDLPSQPHHAVILHDHRVHAGLHDGGDGPRGFPQLVLENQRVESDESSHASRVQSPHHVGQLFQRKSGFRPRGKMFQAEIDRIRAGFNGRVQLRPISGRAHDLGLAQS